MRFKRRINRDKLKADLEFLGLLFQRTSYSLNARRKDQGSEGLNAAESSRKFYSGLLESLDVAIPLLGQANKNLSKL